jgi:hypothetical protein
MSVSDPEEEIEWRADSEPWKNERVPSSDFTTIHSVSPFVLAFIIAVNIFFPHSNLFTLVNL